MKVLIVLAFDVPDNPSLVADIVKAIDPPTIPYFAGTLNVVVEPHASALTAWLQEPETTGENQ